MQLYRLIDDVYSLVKSKDIYANKGELVKVISVRTEVLIVEVVTKKGSEIINSGRTFATVKSKLLKV
ncbi:MAG: hypothetical protein IPP61_00400 [Cytophagaceae bacterium]|nr:hypothetical protein [Cytophagaceae bacterium]MBL0323640.1 hypothetical protein [Cytophagaceae bacterium]